MYLFIYLYVYVCVHVCVYIKKGKEVWGLNVVAFQVASRIRSRDAAQQPFKASKSFPRDLTPGNF